MPFNQLKYAGTKVADYTYEKFTVGFMPLLNCEFDRTNHASESLLDTRLCKSQIG